MTYFETIRAILALPITASAKVILIYLFDKQGNNADAWPALNTISRECSLCRQTVVDSTKLLGKHGLLKIKKAKRPSVNESNRYQVDLTSLKNRPVQKINQSKNQTQTSLKSRLKPVQKIDSNDSLNDSLNDSKHKYGDFVFLTDSEFWKLVSTLGLEKTQEMIDALNNGIGSKGYKYKSHYHTILNWISRDEKEQKNDNRQTTKSGTQKQDFSQQKSAYGTEINNDAPKKAFTR